MSDNPIQEVLNDLFRHLEVLETQNAAILQVLKDKELITGNKFSSYLDQAAVASDIKWRAARVRMEHVFANAPEPRATSSASKTREAPETGEGKQEPPKAVNSDAHTQEAKESVDREKQSVSANGQSQDQHAAGPLQGEAKSHALSSAAESATSEPSKKHNTEKSSPAAEKKTVAEKSEAATYDGSEPANRGEQNPTEGDSENSNSAIGLANPSEKEAA